jgi:hypothetical protein
VDPRRFRPRVDHPIEVARTITASVARSVRSTQLPTDDGVAAHHFRVIVKRLSLTLRPFHEWSVSSNVMDKMASLLVTFVVSSSYRSVVFQSFILLPTLGLPPSVSILLRGEKSRRRNRLMSRTRGERMSEGWLTEAPPSRSHQKMRNTVGFRLMWLGWVDSGGAHFERCLRLVPVAAHLACSNYPTLHLPSWTNTTTIWRRR